MLTICLALAFAAPLPFPRPDGPIKHDPTAIREFGDHVVAGGTLAITVGEADGGFSYEIKARRGGAGSKSPWGSKPGWFIYPVSPQEIWVYDGDERVHAVWFGDGTSAMSGSVRSPTGAELMRRMPPQVAAQLPARLRKLHAAATRR